MDEHQRRYEAHQKRKRATLIDIMRTRHSDRMFDDKPVDDALIAELAEAAQLAPSSCDRHAIEAIAITGRDNKALLGGLLVGGVGWIHRAPTIILLMGDPTAYKAPGETDFMPYLDAGVMTENILLAATAAGLATTYCNPAVREQHRPFFQAAFGTEIFCGAIAVGHPLPPGWVFDTA